ncbi:substrate-binding domain-containing protein [Geminisphaera colitermitum]|uniref:substrate-binding domain-containing protein n=1 Tax=Geminisphaera colitermitum TaxID=1148786 RepID=UPI001E4B0ADD|nr:substrate-binding domain-containing protein [Geminisphaera colitermitum]
MSRFGQAIRRRQFKDSFYRPLYDAISESAEGQGYGIDEFYLGESPVSDARLTQILRARGIQGVLFFPGADAPDMEFPELDWRYFATVLIGFNTAHEGLHQVCSDYTYDFECALQHVRAAGFRRIGLAITNRVDASTNHAWGSRYLFYRHGIQARDRLPPLFSSKEHLGQEEVCEWFERYRPEVVLSAGRDVRDILMGAGYRVPEEVRVVNLVQRGETGLAGIDPHTVEVGHAAVDLLVSLLHGNHLGQPAFPRMVSIRGHWVEGASFPE